MSDSDSTITATIRWFLMSLVTAATVAIFYLVASPAGWSFGMASVYLIAASAFGCFVLSLAWFIRSRYSKPTEGVEARLDRVATPTSKPGSIESHARTTVAEEHQAAEQSPHSTEDDPVESDTRRNPSLNSSVASSPIEPLTHEAEPPPLAKENGERAETHDVVPLPSSATPVPLRLAGGGSRHPRPEPVVSPVAETPIETPDGDAAKRLAELLNRFERRGFPSGNSSNEPTGDIRRGDRSTGDQELWMHLVEVYGAASIDLRGVSSGSCRITLGSGDIVFYAPQRQRWMWIIFEQSEVAVLRHAAPSGPARTASNPG